MARSLKKGVYAHPSLFKKITNLKKLGKKQVIKT